jgi:membrane-associated phospholipid phosphatase
VRYWLAPAAADRFWISVLAAGFVCYGTLPWLHLRPPRNLGLDNATGTRTPTPSHETSRAGLHGMLRRFNEWFLDMTSVGASTFPSGHVATASAAALMVTAASGVAGAPMLVLTALIAIATVAGKYHYAVDALAGLLAGAAGWLLGLLIASR